MKLYKKIAVALFVVVATSCSLDLRNDPNSVQPNQVLPTLMLNSMQSNFAGFFNGASGVGRGLTRQVNRGSSLYRQTITPETFNGVWTTAYASVLEDADVLMDLSVPDKSKPNERYARHMGITRIIQAYTIVTLVDMFGDVPFSDAFKGDGNFNPSVDTQADLYARALVLLDSAKLDLTTPTTTSVPPGYHSPIAPDVFDMYYGNGAGAPTTTFANWLKLANSLKLKIYLNLRLTDAAGAAAGISAIITENNLIDDQNENFIFRYGTTTADPDARHPSFVGQYPGGGGDYQSNWYMWAMLYGYDAKHRNLDSGDPRTRFYFYRQTLTNSTSTNEIRCLGESLPTHYPSSTGTAIIDNSIAGRAPMGVRSLDPTNDPADVAWIRTFCYPSNIGYWGRDHIDPQGIPPDGQLRTAYGPYPVGGRFDANNGAPLGVTGSANFGMRGAGMEPIMLRSFVQFMLAEASLYLTVGGAGAATYFTNGVNFSLIDVRDWSVNGTFGSSGVAAALTEATAINAFYSNAYTGTATAGGPVRAATTGNLPALSGLLTIDGITLAPGDRVLVKNQATATAATNGIYVVSAGAWTRATDADVAAEFQSQRVDVSPFPLPYPAGNVNGGTVWIQTVTTNPPPTPPFVLGTSALTYAVNNSYTVDRTAYSLQAVNAFTASLAGSSDIIPGTVADEAMNYVAREYWIASNGNGVEAYNLYRRTGMPSGMQPVLNPTPGDFPMSYWYPANFANLNSSVTQKNDLAGKVFWDTNTTNLSF